MAAKNTFVDEYISIAYSEEFQLHVQTGFSYSLSRGNQLLSIMLFSREDWQWQMETQLAPVKSPLGEVSPQAPTLKDQIVPFDFEAFHGQRLWRELISPQGKLLMKSAFYFLDDSSHTVCIRINDTASISEDVVGELLSNISFPGQAEYETAAATSQIDVEFQSPYAVELQYFVTYGAKRTGQSNKYNITYSGDCFTDEQRVALDQFVAEEQALSIIVLERVYAYYTKEELPTLKGFVPAEFLPQVSCPEDMGSLISLEGIHLHAARTDGEVPIGLSFNSSWSDNDIGVRIVGITVEEVGTAYVALDEG